MSAHAQDQEEPAGNGNTTLLQRLVLGAGNEKVAIDTPQAVTVIHQEDIDQAQPTTIGDAFETVPGATAIGSDRIFGESFNIRGIGGLEASDESKIIVSVDGAVKFFEQYRMGSLFTEPELYKQVEILRGPASSTLYGSGALGGVINLTTKDASDFLKDGNNNALRFKSAYDSNGDGVLGSTIFATRLSENFEFLATGIYRQSDLFKDGDGNGILGSEFQTWSGLVKGTYRFGDNNEQAVGLSYQHWDGTADNQAYSQTGTLSAFGNVDRHVTDNTYVFTYENPDSDNPWIDIKANLTYSDTTNRQENATSFIPDPLFTDTDYAYRTWSGKLENTFEQMGQSFENYLTVGLQASHQSRIADTVNNTNLAFHPEGTDTRFGIYVQDEFIWNDKLTIIPGARIDFTEIKPDPSLGASDKNGTAFSPKLAIHYKFNDTFSAFGSVAHTERFPTIDEIFASSGPPTRPPLTYPGGRTFSPGLEKETSNNYEIGFALSGYDLVTAGDSAQLKTTAFYNDLSNLIAPNPDNAQPTPVEYYVNVSKARIYGVEVEAAYESDRFFARAAASLVEGEDRTTGAPLTTIPAHSLSLTIGGRMPDYGLEFGWRGYVAASAPAGTNGPTSSYVKHDLFTSWVPEDGPMAGFEARASIENLFDVQYQPNLSGDPGKGRTFKASLVKQFGW